MNTAQETPFNPYKRDPNVLDNQYNVPDTDLEHENPKGKGVHWFWWVFWLVLFLPALFLVALVHEEKLSVVERKNRYRYQRINQLRELENKK